LVGAILNILCPRERLVFQSKLGVSSSNQCNLHHSPHTGHLEKKIKKGYNLFRAPCISLKLHFDSHSAYGFFFFFNLRCNPCGFWPVQLSLSILSTKVFTECRCQRHVNPLT